MPQTEQHTDLGRWTLLLFVGVLATVLWAPLPFGSIEPWAVGLLRILALGLVATWAVACAARGVVVFSRSPLQLVMFGAAAFAFIQSIPLAGASPISTDPFESKQAALTILCFSSLFSVALVALDRPSRLEVAALTLFWFGFGLSVLGILQSLSGTTSIYGFRESPAQLFFGPFPNKNHFAGLMELLLPLGLGPLFAGAIPRSRRGLYAFAGVVISTAVVLSRSRGGLVSLVAELVFLGVVAVVSVPAEGDRRSKRLATTAAGVLALGAAVLIGVIWVGADKVVDSLAELPQTASSESAISRNVIWGDTLSLVRDHTVAGAGIGAYRVAFAGYTTSSGAATVMHAHNDYLQVLADAGIVGAVLAILLCAGLGFYVVKGLRQALPVVRGVALGAGAGCFGLLVHSFVDFNLQIPSNALVFLFLVALVVRAASAGRTTASVVRRTI